MRYLLIENKGEISPDALTLMGGTTKRNDSSKIGHFGSGNKYSIATLLKNNIPFYIFSGLDPITIKTQQVDFRGTTLEKIYVNGKETSLTTSMGPDWELWFAIREWYSNAIDEGEATVVLNTEIVSNKSGYTRFYIEVTEGIQKVVDNWDSYFSYDRTDAIETVNGSTIFPQRDEDNSFILYRKGIRCHYDNKVKSFYNYDLSSVEINESRVVSNIYSAKTQIAELLNKITNKKVIHNILKNAYKEESMEKDIPWDTWRISKLSNTFREVIGDHRIIIGDIGGYFLKEQQTYDCFIVSMSLAKLIRKSFPEVIVYGLVSDGEDDVNLREVEVSKKMNFLLKEVNRFFEEAEYKIEYPIKIVDFLRQEEMLGLALNDTIYISYKQFEKGKKEIAATLIEENEHLKTKLKDESRAFQNHFINLFLSQMEERISHFL